MLTADQLAEIQTFLNAKKPDGTPLATPEERAEFAQIFADQEAYERERPWAKYRHDPVGYCEDILGVKLTPDQKMVLAAMRKPPYRVCIESGHSLGKTFLEACLVNWFWDNFDPGVVVTTAVKFESLVNILWSEIRSQRRQVQAKFPNYPLGFIGPRAPELRSSDQHWAIGIVADKGEAFQGRHHKRMLFLFDEAEGLALAYFTATASMFQPDGDHFWLCALNPTTLSSPVFLETRKTDATGKPLWKVFNFSALNHPNIDAGLRGQTPPIPGAVTLGQVYEWIKTYHCDRISPDEAELTDFEFPPNSQCWWRPGPEAEARILGRRPTRGSDSVWNDSLFEACVRLYANMPESLLPFPMDQMPELGCDVARVLGGDDCDTHGRWGVFSLVHDSANGRPIPATVGKLKQMADELCEFANRIRQERMKDRYFPWYPYQIPVKIDDGNAGGAVCDLAGDYHFIPVNSARASDQELKYPNVRSELWFETAEQARLMGVSFALLEEEWREKLKIQFMAPKWSLDVRGRRVVEPKDKTKVRLGRSPDIADSVNLCYRRYGLGVASMIGPKLSDHTQSIAKAMGLYGRKKPEPEEEDIPAEQPERQGLLRTGRGRPLLFSRR